MQIQGFRCFGEQAGDGNPALVIEGDLSPPEARKAFARERNITCVWIDPPDEAGVAAGALSALLGHAITLRQGRATGRCCRIETRLEGADMLVGGRAQAA